MNHSRRTKPRAHSGVGRVSHDGAGGGQIKSLTSGTKSPVFKRQAKKPQRDDPPPKMRPTAHAPAEEKKSKRRRNLVGVAI